jgi:hypothetical protein
MSAWRNTYPRLVTKPGGKSTLERYWILEQMTRRLHSFFNLTCDICFSLISLHDTQDGRDPRITLDTDSLGEDCLICDVIRKTLEPFLKGERMLVGYITLDWSGNFCLDFIFGTCRENTQRRLLQLYSPGMFFSHYITLLLTKADTQDFQHYLRVDQDFGTTPLSASTIAKIKVWIEKCDNGHECMSSKRKNQPYKPFRPTRLIEVEPDNSNTVKLDCSSKPAKYAALSYCWGMSVQSTTTKSNLSARQQGLVISQLPRTLQDAIAMTRALGLRYIWIDALCIVQDDRDDWSNEAAMMEAVYSEAYLVIAATGAADCEEGFLVSRAEPREIHATNSRGQSMKVHARQLHSHSFRVEDRSFSTQDFPLFQRAWW